MKKLLSLLALVSALLLINSRDSSGQGHLHIVQIDSFPQLPVDTAYNGLVYHNIRVVVTNVGSTNFFGDIHVYLQSQSTGTTIDTLLDGPHPPYLLQPGDTETIHADPNYTFKTIHYAAGDNIIVVWPFSVNTPFDTYQTEVYYVLTVGMTDPVKTKLTVSPNPVSGFLYLDYGPENKVEQVRIYDLVGREVYNVNEDIHAINLSGYHEGIYFLELVQKDGKQEMTKILITGK